MDAADMGRGWFFYIALSRMERGEGITKRSWLLNIHACPTKANNPLHSRAAPGEFGGISEFRVIIRAD